MLYLGETARFGLVGSSGLQVERVEGQHKPQLHYSTLAAHRGLCLPHCTAAERKPAGMPDDREKHLLSSVRGSSADKQTPEDIKIDLLLPTPTGTSHGSSKPLLDSAIMIRHS